MFLLNFNAYSDPQFYSQECIQQKCVVIFTKIQAQKCPGLHL